MRKTVSLDNFVRAMQNFEKAFHERHKRPAWELGNNHAVLLFLLITRFSSYVTGRRGGGFGRALKFKQGACSGSSDMTPLEFCFCFLWLGNPRLATTPENAPG